MVEEAFGFASSTALWSDFEALEEAAGLEAAGAEDTAAPEEVPFDDAGADEALLEAAEEERVSVSWDGCSPKNPVIKPSSAVVLKSPPTTWLL